MKRHFLTHLFDDTPTFINFKHFYVSTESVSLVNRTSSSPAPVTSQTLTFSLYLEMVVERRQVTEDLEVLETKMLELGDDFLWKFTTGGLTDTELNMTSRFTTPPPQDELDVITSSTAQTSDNLRLMDGRFSTDEKTSAVFKYPNTTFIAVDQKINCPLVTANISYDNSTMFTFYCEVNTSKREDTRSLNLHSNCTLYYTDIWELIPSTYYVINEDMTIDVCYNWSTKHQLHPTTEPLFHPGLVVTSHVCIGLSIFMLSLTLLTYVIFPALQTLPGKCIMGFSASLLVALLLFLIGGFVTPRSTLCQFVGVATHAMLLSAFTWMVLCTTHMYHVFTNLKIADHNLSKRKSNRKFALKVFISIVIPVAIVSITITANVIKKDKDVVEIIAEPKYNLGRQNTSSCGKKKTLHIGYGDGLCYISNVASLIGAGIIPVIVSCVINLMLYLATTCSLRRMSSQQQLVRQEPKNNISVYAKLSTLTGK